MGPKRQAKGEAGKKKAQSKKAKQEKLFNEKEIELLQHIFNQDHLLERILRSIIIHDHNSQLVCMQVCKRWYDAVKRIVDRKGDTTSARLAAIRSGNRPAMLDFARGVRAFG